MFQYNYNPMTDLCHDSQGIIRLNHPSEYLKHALDSYFAGRNEDSIDVD
jgi:hypothetical protein